MREVEVGVEFSSGPDLTGFDTAVIGWVPHDEERLSSVCEEHDEIVKEGGLIGFDGEVVVGVALSD